MKIDNLLRPTKKQLQKKAMLAFFQEDFEKSFRIYEIAYWQDTKDLDSLIGLYLSDIALDFKFEALNIFDLYQNALKAHPKSQKKIVQALILDLIDMFDKKVNTDVKELEKREKFIFNAYEGIDAMSFQDLKIVLEKSEFRDAFNYILTNSKLIFYKKDDFYEFLKLLINNDYLDMSMHYIDNLPKYDEDIIPIIEEANKKMTQRELKKIKNNGKNGKNGREQTTNTDKL